MPDAREWFIIAFSRLADINNQMIDEGSSLVGDVRSEV